jgi:hypothetical protein
MASKVSRCASRDVKGNSVETAAIIDRVVLVPKRSRECRGIYTKRYAWLSQFQLQEETE